MVTDDLIETCCPGCGAWVKDLDGFGVLYHPECGYCQHPSVDIGDDGSRVCGLCERKVEP